MDLNQAVICLLSRWLTILYIVHHGRCFDTYSQSLLQGYIQHHRNCSYSMFFQVNHPEYIVPSEFLSCICIHCFGLFTDLAISTFLQSAVNLTPMAFFNSLCQLKDKLVVYVMYVVYCTVLYYIGFALNDSNASLVRYFLWQK